MDLPIENKSFHPFAESGTMSRAVSTSTACVHGCSLMSYLNAHGLVVYLLQVGRADLMVKDARARWFPKLITRYVGPLPSATATQLSPIFAVASFVHWQSIDSQVAWISLRVWGEKDPYSSWIEPALFYRYYRILNPTSNDAGIISGFWRLIDSSYLFD